MTFSGTNPPLSIAIIGGGFCGTMTAIHLLQSRCPRLHIHLINKGYPIAKGVAYAPHTAGLLLNVPNGRMSAFADQPGHYTQWLCKNFAFPGMDPEGLAQGFSTRRQYGQYLSGLLDEAVKGHCENTRFSVHHAYATDLAEQNGRLRVSLENQPALTADHVILATGNNLPGFPAALSPAIAGKFYFGDPWKKESIQNLSPQGDILILGNGLTMADTVTGLAENGFSQTIHTISPHGYRLQPWQEAKPAYTDFTLQEETRLPDLLKTFNRHRKIALQQDRSVCSIIDSLRPHTRQLWRGFSPREKQQFIHHLSAAWNTARHRVPPKMFSQVESLRMEKQLVTRKGYLLSARESKGLAEVTLDCGGRPARLTVQRIINCTGPEMRPGRAGNELLHNLIKKGMIRTGPCGIGMDTCCENGSLTSSGNLFVTGSNLKGVLWESTAVPELSVQVQQLAQHILDKAAQKAPQPN